jgi:hypothetical protein
LLEVGQKGPSLEMLQVGFGLTTKTPEADSEQPVALLLTTTV